MTRVRRVLATAGALAVLGWLGVALLAGPAAPAALCREAFSPVENNFRSLPDSPAVAVLRERFGQGVTAADGRKLYDLIVARGYRRGLEVGTARGYSATWIGLAMSQTGGKLITIEIDQAIARIARKNLRRAELSDVVDSRVNDALAEIPAIAGEFDFVFLDLGGPHHKELLDLIRPRLAKGGAIVSHNAYFLRFTQPEYLPAIRAASDLESWIVPTLSGGIAVSVRRLR